MLWPSLYIRNLVSFLASEYLIITWSSIRGISIIISSAGLGFPFSTGSLIVIVVVKWSDKSLVVLQLGQFIGPIILAIYSS
jgi:hypothetical protein